MPAADSRWPTFVFTEPVEQRLILRPPFAENVGECANLDRVAQGRAGAVCFDIS